MEVSQIFLHPNYDDNNIDFDFTLIKLAQPVELNDHVAPACFPGPEDDLTNTFPPGRDCILSGNNVYLLNLYPRKLLNMLCYSDLCTKELVYLHPLAA